MPQFPESVTILCSSDGMVAEGIEFDGAEFPWHLDESGATIDFQGSELARVNLPILVDADRISTRRKES